MEALTRKHVFMTASGNASTIDRAMERKTKTKVLDVDTQGFLKKRRRTTP